MRKRKAAVGFAQIVSMVMAVLVITVSGYMLYNFFTDSNETLQRCITGTCVKSTDTCMPDGATTGRPCGGDEANAYCVQSYDEIPDNCIVSPTTSEDEEQEEQREQERRPVNNQERQEEETSPENTEAYIEVREEDSQDHKGEGQSSIRLTGGEERQIHIWLRGSEEATCETTILRDSEALSDLPSATGPCGHPLGTENKTDNDVITMTLNTTEYAENDATYELQVIASTQGSRIASIEKRLQIS